MDLLQVTWPPGVVQHLQSRMPLVEAGDGPASAAAPAWSLACDDGSQNAVPVPVSVSKASWHLKPCLATRLSGLAFWLTGGQGEGLGQKPPTHDLALTLPQGQVVTSRCRD